MMGYWERGYLEHGNRKNYNTRGRIGYQNIGEEKEYEIWKK